MMNDELCDFLRLILEKIRMGICLVYRYIHHS